MKGRLKVERGKKEETSKPTGSLIGPRQGKDRLRWFAPRDRIKKGKNLQHQHWEPEELSEKKKKKKN